MWRPEDDALLVRLEDEMLLDALFDYHLGRSATEDERPHPRAAGLVTLAREVTPETHDVAELARLLETPPMKGKPPPLLHHLALYFGRVSDVLEQTSPEAAARARVLSLSAWLALEEEEAYLAALAASIASREGNRAALDMVADIGRRAEATSRDLAPSGRAALLSLASIDDAVRISGIGDLTARPARASAQKGRAAAVDAALASIDEGFEDAAARSELTKTAGKILARVLDVWAWSAHDEAVEQFAVERLATVGWELYRARKWDDLRVLLDPFRPLFDRMALRIENDPSHVAFAAACAQMFVFLADVEKDELLRLAQAERAVRVCPTHRNGRLVLSGLLCDHAMATLRTMIVVSRKAELERAERMIGRAEALHHGDDVDRAKAALERARKLPTF